MIEEGLWLTFKFVALGNAIFILVWLGYRLTLWPQHPPLYIAIDALIIVGSIMVANIYREGGRMILTTDYLERLIAESRWLPTGLTRVYIEPGITVELNRTSSGWIVSVRRRPEGLPIVGDKNFTAPDNVPDYFVSQDKD